MNSINHNSEAQYFEEFSKFIVRRVEKDFFN